MNRKRAQQGEQTRIAYIIAKFVCRPVCGFEVRIRSSVAYALRWNNLLAVSEVAILSFEYTLMYQLVDIIAEANLCSL